MESAEEPSLRQCLVVRPSQGSCGFHLSRTQWDPYPWVSDVEPGSAADKAGLVVGDCVLEVNGEDVLGMRIGAVALRVYARGDQVRLLVWNSGVEYNGAIWCSGNGPTPLSLQRLASCLQSVVSLLECPVCLETIPPPAFQCYNGHTLCGVCRSLTDRCPVCRVPLGPRGRCLLADKIHTLFTATFLHSGGKKKKQSTAWRGETAKLPRLLQGGGGAPPVYPCPLAPCEGVVRAGDLISHLQSHDGPVVQYFCKDSSTLLHLPVSRLTTVTTAQGLTFLLHVAPVADTPALLLWLWLAAPDTTRYRIQLDRPAPLASLVRPAVFPISWSPSKVIACAAEQCVVLNDCDFDTNKVKITILSDQSATLS